MSVFAQIGRETGRLPSWFVQGGFNRHPHLAQESFLSNALRRASRDWNSSFDPSLGKPERS